MPARPVTGFVAAILAIVVAVGVYLAVAKSRQENAARAAESTDAVLALERLDAAVREAESSHRGYLLVRGPAELARHERAVAAIRVELASLTQRASREPQRRAPTDALVGRVDAALAAMAEERRAHDAALLTGASWHPTTDPHLLDDMEHARGELVALEVGALEQRERAWSGKTALGDAVFLVANLALAAVLLLAARSVRQALRAHEERERERRVALEVQARILGIVGHDLRTPLSAIEAGATLLSRRTLPPAEARTLARILSSSRRMARMIGDLLDFTRVRDAGGIPLAPRAMDLREVCRPVVDEAALRHGPDAVALSLDGNLSGAWDPDRLQQAIANLVSNALQYQPAGTPVRLRAAGEADAVRVEVENDGPPIPPEATRAIFEPFRRGDVRQAGADGLGLGLFIVRTIVEAHGGRVDVASGPGRPTRFTVRLPRTGGLRPAVYSAGAR
ncbi:MULTISPECIES: ATP-binding protein [Anaeromyxobacter]|uniref:sensor histidine kinase n=1 Tax=Anaeromyxobacter TaxID=161492 RepID=UPI001F569561|nr:MULTISPECIES: ATP-binding protein [unclassified Anaeromyxobacter]